MIRIEHHNGIATLYVDRPPVNAIDNQFLDRADAELLRLHDATGLRALVITGAGHCFSAGLDLKIVPRYTPNEQLHTIDGINRLVARLYALPVPTIAAVNGHAIAGGLILALACDYRVGTNAPCQIGLTEARAGIPFPAVAMQVLQAELSPAIARRLTLLARNYGPEAAHADGILDELQPPERVLSRAQELATDLAGIPADAYRRVKHQLRAVTIAANRAVVEGRDPLADSWLSSEVGAASAALLGRTP
jgi:enoyl-CoA hydratase/carnithine racemase